MFLAWALHSCSSHSCLSVTSTHSKASDLNPLMYRGVPHIYISSGLVSISCQSQTGYSHPHSAFPWVKCASLVKLGFYLVSQGHIDCFLLFSSAWLKSLPPCSTVFKDRRILFTGHSYKHLPMKYDQYSPPSKLLGDASHQKGARSISLRSPSHLMGFYSWFLTRGWQNTLLHQPWEHPYSLTQQHESYLSSQELFGVSFSHTPALSWHHWTQHV